MTDHSCNCRHQIKTYTSLSWLTFLENTLTHLKFHYQKTFYRSQSQISKANSSICNTKSTKEEQFRTQLLGPTNWGEEWEKRRKTQSRDTQVSIAVSGQLWSLSTIFVIFLRLFRLWPWISPGLLRLHPFNFAVLYDLVVWEDVCNWCRLFK